MANTGGPARVTFFGLSFYAVACLIAMATMSVGAAVLFAAVLFDAQGLGRGPRGLGAELKSVFASRLVRVYALVSALVVLSWTLSLVSATIYPLVFDGAAPAVAWPGDLGKAWYFLLPIALLVAWRRLDETRRARVLATWLCTFGLLSFVGIPQFFTGWPREQPNPLLPGYFHPILFLGHHLSVANVWIFPFFAGLDVLATRELRERLRLPVPALIVFLGAALFTLVLGYSRTLWVALPAGLLLWAALRLPPRLALAGGAMLLACCAALARTAAFSRRLGSDMGVGDRMMLWKANLEFFRHRPMFGVGFGKNQALSYHYQHALDPARGDYFVGHAHSIYLEVLAGTGILGVLAWLAWNGVVLFALLRARSQARSGEGARAPIFGSGALCAWVVLLLNGVTQVNFWEGKVMHQFMWITALALFWSAELTRAAAPGAALSEADRRSAAR